MFPIGTTVATLEMMKLYPQPTKSIPSVEYPPIPHPATPGKSPS